MIQLLALGWPAAKNLTSPPRPQPLFSQWSFFPAYLHWPGVGNAKPGPRGLCMT